VVYPPATKLRAVAHEDWTVTITGEGNTRELVAVLKQPGVPRPLNDLIEVIPSDDSGVNRPAHGLKVVGEIKPDVVGSPALLPLGRVKVGSVVEESFRLVSLSGRKFEVLEVAGETADVTVTKESSDPKAYTARVTVTGTGEQTRRITAKVKQDDGNQAFSTLLVRYHGEGGVAK
jgi:hypothetical protein